MEEIKIRSNELAVGYVIYKVAIAANLNINKYCKSNLLNTA
jgi:hypothetical protein